MAATGAAITGAINGAGIGVEAGGGATGAAMRGAVGGGGGGVSATGAGALIVGASGAGIMDGAAGVRRGGPATGGMGGEKGSGAGRGGAGRMVGAAASSTAARSLGAGGCVKGVIVSSIGGTARIGSRTVGGSGWTRESEKASRAAAEAERSSRRTSSGLGAAASLRAASVRTGRFPKLRYFKPGVFMAAATRATSGSWPIENQNPCCRPGRRMPAKPYARNPIFFESAGFHLTFALPGSGIALSESGKQAQRA